MGAINLGGGGGGKDAHKHHNMIVIDELNDSNGVLTYKGKEIITSGGSSSILATQVIETEDRKFLSKKEKESLSGVKGNIQAQIDIAKTIAEGRMRFRGRFNSYADLIKQILDPDECDVAFIDNDETQENASTIYYYTAKKWIRIKKDKAGSNGWIASNTAPVDKNLLWVDVSKSDPVLKYFNGSSWVDISGLKEVPASKVIQERNLRFVTDNSDMILNKMEEDSDTGLLMYNGKIIGTGAGGSGANIDDTNIAIDTTFSSLKITDELKKKQNELGFIPENASSKGKANGYVPLNSKTKIDNKYTTLYNFSVSDIIERDKLTNVEHGSTCYIESTTELFVYTMANEWIVVSKGNAINLSRNNYEGLRNPVHDDDESEGYGIGSIWVNTLTTRAYICTKAMVNEAVWELMAGSVTLNIGEVIPFKLDPVSFIVNEDKYYYEVPTMNIDTDYMELTVNGHELIKDVHYEIVNSDEKTHIAIYEELKSTDFIFGEIFKHDLKKAEEQMMKSVYDSNNNGKVDLAEIADITKGFLEWTKEKRYEIGEFVFIEGTLYTPKEAHTSGLIFEKEKWIMIKAEPYDLNKFSTDDLEPTNNRSYVESSQIPDIEDIPNLRNRISNNEKNISTNTRNISLLTSEKNVLKNRLDNLRFTQLIDTPSALTTNSYLKIAENYKGEKYIVNDPNPLFAVKSIIDSSGKTYRQIDTPKFTNMRMEKQSSNGVFEFKLDATTFDLNDMPTTHEHGKVLVSDLNNNKYVLADKEDLTMSVENFNCIVESSDWEEVDGKFEKTIFHDMASEAVIVSFTDELKINDLSIKYEVLNKSNIKIYSNVRKDIKCVINCALGAGNGYWQYLMDWSKIDFVDDSKVRTDRAYSSSKLENMLKSYALKNDYYTKQVSDSRFAIKELEHDHLNKAVLDKLSVDANGDVEFNSKRLLTEMNPLTVSLEDNHSLNELTEIYNMKSICEENTLQAIIASEILVKNTGSTECTFKIKDGNFDLVTIKLMPEEVQKYHLGVSNKVKIFGQGDLLTMLSISAF